MNISGLKERTRRSTSRGLLRRRIKVPQASARGFRLVSQLIKSNLAPFIIFQYHSLALTVTGLTADEELLSSALNLQLTILIHELNGCGYSDRNLANYVR